MAETAKTRTREEHSKDAIGPAQKKAKETKQSNPVFSCKERKAIEVEIEEARKWIRSTKLRVAVDPEDGSFMFALDKGHKIFGTNFEASFYDDDGNPVEAIERQYIADQDMLQWIMQPGERKPVQMVLKVFTSHRTFQREINFKRFDFGQFTRK